jgi:RimJ/RimL family protein N-acetyltransferase
MSILEEVYQSSFEWAQLGLESVQTDFGALVFNKDDSSHHEGNAAWKLSSANVESDIVGLVEQQYRSRGLVCHNWVPALSSPETDAILASEGFKDSPAFGFARKPARFSIPNNIEFVSAKVDPELHISVYLLPGQRWSNDSTRIQQSIARLTSSDGYTPYTCVRDGQPIGRIGALKTASGALRVKSIFVGAEFRNQGVAVTMLNHVSTIASDQGASMIFSEVECDNVASVQLHKAFGFESVGILHCYSRNA